MTGRESVEDKARRLLATGRLTVTSVVGDHVAAVCQGDTGCYDLGHQPGRGWWCSCAVRTDRCSHLAALWLITIRRRAPDPTSSAPAQPGPCARLNPAA